jgi:hypothetical protein
MEKSGQESSKRANDHVDALSRKLPAGVRSEVQPELDSIRSDVRQISPAVISQIGTAMSPVAPMMATLQQVVSLDAAAHQRITVDLLLAHGGIWHSHFADEGWYTEGKFSQPTPGGPLDFEATTYDHKPGADRTRVVQRFKAKAPIAVPREGVQLLTVPVARTTKDGDGTEHPTDNWFFFELSVGVYGKYAGEEAGGFHGANMHFYAPSGVQ